MSVFTLASAIARVFCGFETATLATRGSSSLTIACVLQVASSATSSLTARLSANSRSASGGRPDLADLANLPVLPDRDLGEFAVNVEPDAPAHAPPSFRLSTWESRRANDNYGFALAAQPGESQGAAKY